MELIIAAILAFLFTLWVLWATTNITDNKEKIKELAHRVNNTKG